MPLLPTAMNTSTRRLLCGLLVPLFGTAVYNLSLLTKAPKGLRATPPAFWPGNQERGREILKGRFDLGVGRAVVSVDPWAAEGGTDAFKAALNGFSWLRDLVVLPERDAVRGRVITMLGDWLARNGRWSPIAWRADILGERVVSWLTHYDIIIATAGETFRRGMLRNLAHQLVHLRRVCDLEVDGAARIRALKGLVYGGACLSDSDTQLRSALRRLHSEIDRQVFPDGGHIERNPSTQHRVLRDLVDIRATLLAANQDIPPYLQNAIDRMAPMLRLFRHADGSLALFNGSREEPATDVDITLTKAEAKGQPPRNAPYTGFERLAAGRLLAIVDAGGPPPAGLDATAHAGTLSFELSVGRERLIVNCGATIAENEAWKRAQRTTAAHSTLSIADTNSSEVNTVSGIGRRPRHVRSERLDDEAETAIDMSHDGYAPTFGATHHRRLRLDKLEERLDGEDRIDGPADQDFTIRFHLHPAVSASIVKSGTAALLRLPKGGGWRLAVDGAPLRLDESIYLGGQGVPRRSQQVVIDGKTVKGQTAIAWSIAPER